MKTRENIRCFHPRIGGSLAISILFLVVSPSTAIDFSPLPPAFVENFTGEISTPTTPEIDLFGTSGLTVDGTFSGSAAQLSIDDVDIDSLTLFSLVDTTSVSTHGSDPGTGRICPIRSAVVRTLLTGGAEKGPSFSYSPQLRRGRTKCPTRI